MRNNDQIAIFESYRDEILKKFKQGMSGEGNDEPEIKDESEKNIESSIGEENPEGSESNSEDIDTTEFDASEFDDLDDDDDSDFKKEERPKRNVVVKSEEVGVRLNPQLREILRHLPSLSEDTEILTNIKAAINKANSKLPDDDQITMSPLAAYDELFKSGAVSEEEMDSDEFDEKEAGLLQSFDDDDYSDDDIDHRDEQMRRDIEKGKLQDIIRQMGTDWRDSEEDFRSSNY